MTYGFAAVSERQLSTFFVGSPPDQASRRRIGNCKILSRKRSRRLELGRRAGSSYALPNRATAAKSLTWRCVSCKSTISEVSGCKLRILNATHFLSWMCIYGAYNYYDLVRQVSTFLCRCQCVGLSLLAQQGDGIKPTAFDARVQGRNHITEATHWSAYRQRGSSTCPGTRLSSALKSSSRQHGSTLCNEADSTGS